jgi:hypothetical protein
MKMMLCFALASTLPFASAEVNFRGEVEHKSAEPELWLRPGELPPAAPKVTPLVKPLKVHLEKMKARQNHVATLYVGKVTAGEPPQELTVIFDTSSGHVLVPHAACKSSACVEHKRYSPWKSTTASDVNVDGELVDKGHRFARHGLVRTGVSVDFTQSDLGEGTAKCVVVRDDVCIEGDKGNACVDLELVTAIKEQETPFRAMPNDGIVGLGLDSLAAGPKLSFMSTLMGESKDVPLQFGISLGPESGDIFFGGQDPSLKSPLQWMPVNHPDSGYWQVDVKSVRVGGVVVDECRRGCHGIVDSGTSHLGVQSYRLHNLRPTLVTQALPGGECTGPVLEFDLGAMVITLDAKDYSDDSCTPSVGSLNLEEPAFVGVYAFGESVLQRYYVGFDWANKQVGFAPASASPPVVVV